MSNVVSMQAARDLRKQTQQEEDHAYHAKILCMDKVELLEEMVRFQQERSSIGSLTTEMMVRGRILFRALEENAETQELKILSRSYRRHLEFELAELKKTR